MKLGIFIIQFVESWLKKKNSRETDGDKYLKGWQAKVELKFYVAEGIEQPNNDM